MKSLKALKTKLESVKKLSTADKIANKFRDNTELDLHIYFDGVNVWNGSDTIEIWVNGRRKFRFTYDKPIWYNY